MVPANLDLFPAEEINNPRALSVNPVAQASDTGACGGAVYLSGDELCTQARQATHIRPGPTCQEPPAIFIWELPP